jgi:hypothetical protein
LRFLPAAAQEKNCRQRGEEENARARVFHCRKVPQA